MPAEVLVGVKANPPKVDSQAPPIPEGAPVMVMAPAALVMAIPPAPVRVAAVGALPVLPIKSCPLVKVIGLIGEVPLPIKMPFWVRVAMPVPPLTTERVEVEVRAEAAFPRRISPEASVVAPVPPEATESGASKVRVPPAMVTLPLNLEAPKTPSVVVGLAVPIPTRFSLALTTKVLSWVSKIPDQAKVEVAEGETADRAPVTRRVLSMVELALTNIPAVVEVGERAVSAKMDSQAPGAPEELPPQAPPDLERSPVASVWTHSVPDPARLSKVIAPVAVRAPFSLVAPNTPKVVVGEAVPIPTRFSLALTTKVLSWVSKIPDQAKVEVAEGEVALKAPVTRRVLSMVEEALT